MLTIPRLAQALELLTREYRQRTPKSSRAHDAARAQLPGGDTRSTTFFEPYPLYVDRGEGCRVVDLDGSSYLDLLGNYTSLIHGHAHPHILRAVSEQLPRGTAFGSPIEAQTRLAAELRRRLPSLQSVRFCNSGTEATMCAIRAAKAFTGRPKLLKIEGGYHGSHDAADHSVAPPLALAGPPDAPVPVPGSPGLFSGVTQDVVIAPFNDIESTAQIIARHAGELAAIIVEPVLGSAGVIPAMRDYVEFLRAAATGCGALLIFDEVVTLRLNFGGAQRLYGVEPDLTALGKFIGGGFPIGAFGGRLDVMQQFDPRAGKMRHAGTFNGNAISMVAGIAALELLDAGEIERLNGQGDRLRSALNGLLEQLQVDAYIGGIGSLLQLRLFAPSEIRGYRDTLASPRALYDLTHLALVNQGIFGAPRGEYALSTPMTDTDLTWAADRFRRAIEPIADILREENHGE